MNALVSIGMPVYNGEKTLRAAVESILKQTHENLEIIISDNSSTDGTEKICREYQALDSRVLYFRQPSNKGLYANNAFVYQKARGKYFSWAACDDYRSKDFVEANVEFLEKNPEYVASTSPNCFSGCELELVKYSITGSILQRLDTYFQNCMISHGIFYSIIRTDALKNFPDFSDSYLALDWSINFFLVSQGPINREKRGLMVSGTEGISGSQNAYMAFHNSCIEWLLPLLDFSLFVIKNSSQYSWLCKLLIIKNIIRLNFLFANNKIRKHLSIWINNLFLSTQYGK